MNNKLNKIVIATGGTGGHIFPAYSLAKHFIDNKINVEIISDKRGLRYLQNFNNLRITQIVSATIFKKNLLQFLFSTLIFPLNINASLKLTLLLIATYSMSFLIFEIIKNIKYLRVFFGMKNKTLK